MQKQANTISYTVFDPTGNITALVYDPVAEERQKEIADQIMRLRPEVEQVGFLQRLPAGNEEGEAAWALRMAGGEFCGNASMCAAVWTALSERKNGRAMQQETGGAATERQVCLQVSGTAHRIEVRLNRTAVDAYRTAVRMPPALSIEEKRFSFGAQEETLSLVRMEGIDHILIPENASFFAWKETPALAEQAVRAWCEALSASCLGLLFLEETGTSFRMTPLVYVPGSGTLFWEKSCASGSAAVGMARAEKQGRAVHLALQEPGGILRVESDPAGETWLFGNVRFLEAAVAFTP